MDTLVVVTSDPYVTNSMYWSTVWLLLGAGITDYVLRKMGR